MDTTDTPDDFRDAPTLPPEWRKPAFVNATPADAALQSAYGVRSEADLTEIGLIRRAQPFVDAFQGRLPLQRELKDIFEHFGVEIAQTVFAQAVEQSPSYAPFVRRVRSHDMQWDVENARSFEVTIVRSSLPSVEWGAFATEWQQWARSLGFTTDIIETREDADIRENARAISRWLMSHPHPRRILVTYGQGTAEFRSLLTSRFGLRGGTAAADLGELGSIHTWINVNGAYNGASAARVFNDSWFEKLRVSIARNVGAFKSVVALAARWRALDSRLPAFRAQPQIPFPVINVVGLPLKMDLPRSLWVPYAVITPQVGPNDGVLSIFDSLAPGLIVPVPRMSHAAEGLRLEPVFKRVLAVIANDAAAAAEKRHGREESFQPNEI